jgi:biopolymer transport protein ExbB/TolQ
MGAGIRTEVTFDHKIEALDAAKRASERSAAIAHGEMKRGLNSLASIAAIAPFVGIFGTVLGIVNSFQGVDGEKSAILAALEGRLSDSLVPTELGLLVAMLAFCSYKYFLSRLEDCDVEIQNASLQLLNDLASTRF